MACLRQAGVGEEAGLGGRRLSLLSFHSSPCVTLGKSFAFSRPQFPLCERRGWLGSLLRTLPILKASELLKWMAPWCLLGSLPPLPP